MPLTVAIGTTVPSHFCMKKQCGKCEGKWKIVHSVYSLSTRSTGNGYSFTGFVEVGKFKKNSRLSDLYSSVNYLGYSFKKETHLS